MTNSTQPPNLARSAIAPEISATVMIANISWNEENVSSGSVPLTWSSVPCIPTLSRLPSSPDPMSEPKASEYPYRTQRMVTTPMETKLIIIMFRTLLARASPP